MTPYGQTLSPAQHWVLATAALLNQRDGRRLDVLGGAVRPSGSWTAFFLLMKSWGVETTRDATERIEWLLTKGHRGDYEARGAGPAQAFVGWDAMRAAHVAGWAYTAYLLDKNTAWQLTVRAAELLRSAFRSWPEIGQSYVHGLHVWSDGDHEMVDPTAQAAAWLSSHPSSPWVNLPWNIDLTGVAAPHDPPVQEIHVGPNGHARTIGDGVRMAGPDGRVVVAAGSYRECVKPEHSVEIIGNGPVIWESAGDPCVRVIEERTVVLRGLTLRSGLDQKGQTLNAVAAQRGFPRLESCEISATHDGIRLRDWSLAHVFDTRIHQCGQIGLNAPGGHFVVVRSEISQCGKDGILLKAKGPTTIENTRIHHNGGAGISVQDDVEATIRDCDLSGNVGPAEIVGSGNAHIDVENTRISEGRGGGVFFQERSHGSLDEVTVSGCALAALDVGSTEPVTTEKLKLQGNKSSGVLVRRGGRLFMALADLDQSQEGHVWIMSGGRAALVQCRIAGGKLGLWAQGGATVTVYRTVFEQQQGPAVDAQPGANVVVSKCKISGAVGDGIIANGGSNVRVAFSEVGPVGGAGIRALEGAGVRVEDSVLEGARGGDLVGYVTISASKVSGQLGQDGGPGAPEERRKNEDEAFDRAVDAVMNGGE